MVAFNFETIINTLYDMGVYDVVLPFLLVFTIVFAFLQKTYILGKTKAGKPQVKFNAVVAIVMGALAVTQDFVVKIFQNALPNVAATIIGVLMFFILIAMFTGGQTGMPKGGWLRIAILLLPAIAVGYYFLSEVYELFPYFGWISSNIETIIVLAVFGIIIAVITGGEEKGKYPYGDTDYNTKRERSFNMWKDFLKHNENYKPPR